MKTKKNKKIVIFGGSGFLGNSLIKFLIKKDYEIILFTRKASPEKLIEKYKFNSNVKIINWDVNDYELVEQNILNTDCIINLCGILYENKHGDFFRVHSDLPALLGKLSIKNKIFFFFFFHLFYLYKKLYVL